MENQSTEEIKEEIFDEYERQVDMEERKQRHIDNPYDSVIAENQAAIKEEEREEQERHQE